MIYKAIATAALALGGLIVSYPTAFAMTGAGCPDLPDYARAVGTIEMGEGACNMTTAEARRIIAREQGRSVAVQPADAASEPAAKRHHRKKKHPM